MNTSRIPQARTGAMSPTAHRVHTHLVPLLKSELNWVVDYEYIIILNLFDKAFVNCYKLADQADVARGRIGLDQGKAVFTGGFGRTITRIGDEAVIAQLEELPPPVHAKFTESHDAQKVLKLCQSLGLNVLKSEEKSFVLGDPPESLWLRMGIAAYPHGRKWFNDYRQTPKEMGRYHFCRDKREIIEVSNREEQTHHV